MRKNENLFGMCGWNKFLAMDKDRLQKESGKKNFGKGM
jgi:hypothetical protein